MRKLLMKLVAGLMVVGCLFSIVACAPKLKFDKAEEALRDKGYEVEVVHDEDFDGIEGMVERALYAEKDDAWIDIIEFKDKKTAKVYYEATKKDYEGEILMLEGWIDFYELVLDKYSDNLKSDEIDEIEDCIKEYKSEKADWEKDLECLGMKGKCVWEASSTDVIKDAK